MTILLAIGEGQHCPSWISNPHPHIKHWKYWNEADIARWTKHHNFNLSFQTNRTLADTTSV